MLLNVLANDGWWGGKCDNLIRCDATKWMSVATQEKKWMNEEEMTVFIEYKQRQWRQQMIKREKTILSIW